MDQNGKLFGKISIIDLLVLLMIAVLALGIFYRSQGISLKNNARIEYRLEIYGIRELAIPYYQEGLKVYDMKTGAFMGTIKETEAIPLKDKVTLTDGSMVEAEKVNNVQMNLTIESAGIISDKAYLANGNYEIKAGSNVGIQTKYVEVYGLITEVTAEYASPDKK